MSLSGTAEEIIHGHTVHDPYRWLENRNLPETEEWLGEQKARCESYFNECGDLDRIRSRVRQYLDSDVADQPAKVANRYFYRLRKCGQEQGCLYVEDATTGIVRLLADPSEQGPFISVGIHRVSNDGSLLAYELRCGGEDKASIHIVDVQSGRVLADHVQSGYPRGFVFAPNGSGFFYCQETSFEAQEHTICLHVFYKSAADQVVFRVPRTHGSRLVLTADNVHLGAILVSPQSRTFSTDFWIAGHDDPTNWRPLITNSKSPLNPMLKCGRIFALSCHGAPNGKLVELTQEGRESQLIIPQQRTTIRQLVIAGDRAFASYLNHSSSSVRCWTLAGDEERGIEVPSNGTIQLLPNRGGDENAVFYSYESFAQPSALFEYEPAAALSKPWHHRAPVSDQRPVVARQTTYTSKDGATIPITLVRTKDRFEPSMAPVLMASYGGFGVPSTPQFSVLVSIMLELGAVFALPHIRGGGEFGNPWHEAGRGRNRQVCFDDFTSAARWLCDEAITSPTRLAIFGGSNSGLLVGAAMTQCPDQFCAVLCIAPLLDMVRYEIFDQAAKWRHEYGTISDPDDFRALYAYSPYHRIRDSVNYPATLFVSGDKDNRCDPAHVRKMAARLQQRDVQKNPILVDYCDQRGHSAAMPLSFRIEALTRRIAFLCRELHLPFSKPRCL